jgi:hypothetical protein
MTRNKDNKENNGNGSISMNRKKWVIMMI